MTQDWTIQSRGEQCSVTGVPFVAGELFHTLLFLEGATLRREDLSQTAFRERPADAPVPFSLWRSKFEPSPAKPPEPLGKQTAEELLRHYMADPDPRWANIRYILAVMLERKRSLKEIQTVRGEDGSLSRVYQFPKTGEVLVVPDPQLRLDQIATVQTEVAELLGKPSAPPEEVAATEASRTAETAEDTGAAGEAVSSDGTETLAQTVPAEETTSEAASVDSQLRDD
jgi:hypothetical protein